MALSFMSRPASDPGTYAMMGKLPNRADFVRLNAVHPVVGEFDGLVQTALEQMSAGLGWETRYDAAPRTDFYYTSADKRWVFYGGWQASRDSSGRRYPFVAGVIRPVEDLSAEASLVPISLEVFFDGLHSQIANAIDNSVEAVSCREFLQANCVAEARNDADKGLARGLVRQFLESHTVAELEGFLVATGIPSLQQALLNIAFYLAFLRRYENPAVIQEIALPLPVGKGEGALYASTWLTLLTALWGKKPWTGSYFLHAGTSAPGLSVSFGRMPRKLGYVFDGHGSNGAESALDLGKENELWRGHPEYAETAFALGRVLSDPRQPLSIVADLLAEIGKKLSAA
ncbi:type VI secretion system-associated protein TagF [Azospira oryzae]|uniref:type VI secretion system-associated protein TagF n=1 Tax=Azospira oryzae TaxID=146939 RepID=UPI001965D3BD|nr:type VI secretion system-associated protein TagF [Azospira oryzae]